MRAEELHQVGSKHDTAIGSAESALSGCLQGVERGSFAARPVDQRPAPARLPRRAAAGGQRTTGTASGGAQAGLDD